MSTHASISTTTLAVSHVSDKVQSDSASSRLSRMDHALLNLPPSFFSINMGTGIASILLYRLPYNADPVRWIGVGVFLLNVAIFVLLCLGNLVRYIRWKGLFGAVGRHGMSGMFWGCLPMGLATIINMICYVCVPAYGSSWAHLALGLWWIDVVLSLLVNIGMLFMLFTRQKHTAETVSATWLLPIVASVVAAASGGVVADALAPFEAALARGTIIVSYIVWGTGVLPAMMIISLWIMRSAIFGVPPTAALCSVFLPLGPCGQGAFGIALLGRVTRDLAYSHDLPFASIYPTSFTVVAEAICAGGLITALILWGLGCIFYLLAFAILVDHARSPSNRDFFGKQRFSVSLWALTFPIGVFATATIELANQLDSAVLRVLAMLLSCQVVAHWGYVMVMSVWKVVDGSLFVAPELKGLEVQLRWGNHRAEETETRHALEV